MLISLIERGCSHKKRYSDDMGARCAGMLLEDLYGDKLYLYPCKLCRGYHLTRSRQQRLDWAVSYEFQPTPR